MKKAITLICFLLASLTLTAFSQEPYVCEVRVALSPTSWDRGTGALVYKDSTHGVVLTAGHNFRSSTSGITVHYPTEPTPYEARLLDYSYGVRDDLAILLTASPQVEPAVLNPLPVLKDHPVYVQTLRGPIEGMPYVDSITPQYRYSSKGTIPGDSGSVVTQNGQVVGIHWGNYKSSYGFYTARRPLRNVAAWLFGYEYVPIYQTKPHYIIEATPESDSVTSSPWAMVPVKPVEHTVNQYCPGGSCPRPTVPRTMPVQPRTRTPPRPSVIQAPQGTFTPNSKPCNCKPEEVESRLKALEDSLDSLSQTNDEILSELKTAHVKFTSYNESNTLLLGRVENIESSLKEVKPPEIDYDLIINRVTEKLLENQTPSGSQKYYVLVADENASYWPSISPLLAEAEERYSNISTKPVPSKPIGRVPVLVAYKDMTPVANYPGVDQVKDALYTLSQGKVLK